MDFTSAGFLGCLAALAIVYAIVPRGWRCTLLVVASYSFYWLTSQWFAVLLLGATLLTFLAARAKSLLLTTTALLIAVLVLFKALPLFGVNWLLPLGISYYTFKLAGYLIDTHWRSVEPERRLMPFLAFSSFFPQIVAGPIQRAESLLPQVERAESVPLSMAVSGALRILLGFFKKFVIADNLGQIVNYIYGQLGPHHMGSPIGAPVAIAFYGYPLQMYADFSGLTDIAIGAGVLFGIDAPENFMAPFAAATPSEYWRRWHITLTLWLTDYVFTPLRMALRSLGSAGLVMSLFVTMILIGLWHGFRLTFVMFGVVHAIYLSIDALTQKARKRWYKRNKTADSITNWIGPVVTFHLVAAGVVFFRSKTLTEAGLFFRYLFDGWEPFSPAFRQIISQPGRSLYLLAGAYVLMECADAVRRRYWPTPALGLLPRWGRWSVYSCAAISVLITIFLLVTSNQKSSPFLYAIF